MVEPSAEAAAEEPEEAALAWLESLARKQGVPEEQLVTHPLKPIEEPPAWVKADAEAAMEVEEIVPTPTVGEPEEAPEAITEPAVFAEEVEPVLPSDETVPSWLVSEITQPTAPVVEEETQPVLIKPVKKLDLNQATLTELEELPGIGFILAQAILNYREEHGFFTNLDDLALVPGIGPERIEGIKDLVEVVPIPVTAKVEEKILEPKDEDEKLLVRGRDAVSQNDIQAAIESFSILVQKRIFLPEVIDELLQAV
jgi:competence ComEA-like helix-hairpin-helix protein